MSTPTEDNAAELAAQIAASADAENTAKELITMLGTPDVPVVIDVGSSVWLLVLPGWDGVHAALPYVQVAEERP